MNVELSLSAAPGTFAELIAFIHAAEAALGDYAYTDVEVDLSSDLSIILNARSEL